MRVSKYSAALLAPVVASSHSLAAVLRKLGLAATGGNYRYIAMRIRVVELDTSHFRGRGWSRGETRDTHPSVERTRRARTRDDAEVFRIGSAAQGRDLLWRLLARGMPYACAACGLAEWRSARLSLHVDHVNGTNTDNRLENLRLLCPNCHSQTATYCRRRRAP